MELEVYKIDGSKTSKKVTLDEAIYGIEPNDHAIYLDVKQYLANQRQGTASSKERSMVHGSTRKLKRQKGTGGARSGDIKSPLFPGGGRVFGPQPRDYRFKLNKKVKQLARKSALAYKAKENGILIIEDFNMEAPKTKVFKKILESLKVADKKTLIVVSKIEGNVALSARNLQKNKIVTADSINTYEILGAKSLVITESSLRHIEEMFNSKQND
ncbi:MAG: 50S ribosomal protein L4 [Bacteroidota bacterium]|jgi:large subunit ribosomal protein L4